MIYWGHKNRHSRIALMVKHALRIYEDSLCRCGHSSLLTQAADAKIAYRAKTVTCEACAAGERGREKDPGPGDKTYVEDLRDTPGGMDLDADDIIWMPDEDDMVVIDARYSGVNGPQIAGDDSGHDDSHTADRQYPGSAIEDRASIGATLGEAGI